MTKRAATPTARLEKRLAALQGLNNALKENIDRRNALTNSGLAALTGSVAGGQTSMASFNELAYYSIYQPITINWTMLSFMYKTHGILQTAVDMPVLDALRGGIEIESAEMDPDDIKMLQDRLENDDILGAICEAQVWTRLYGGGALVINVPGIQNQPLNISKAKKLEFYPASRWEVQSSNRMSEEYEFYGIKLHKSRVLTMIGKPAPYLVKFVLQGWGMSEMERMIEDFNMYLRTKDVVYELLKEAKVDIYKFDGYTNSLATASGQQLIQTRVQQMNQLKNYVNALMMDMKDDYEQKQITFSGLAEVQKQNMIYIASALRMPLTKLFGLSASGFNSGEDDMENYNAMIESEVRTQLRPVIRKVLNILCLQIWGRTYDIRFKFKPLRVLDDVQQETVNTSKYNRYLSMYQAGAMDPKEFFGLCHKEGLIPIEPAAARGVDPFKQPQIEHAEEMQEGDEDDGPEWGKKDKGGKDK